jgi:hypothetical protein
MRITLNVTRGYDESIELVDMVAKEQRGRAWLAHMLAQHRQLLLEIKQHRDIILIPGLVDVYRYMHEYLDPHDVLSFPCYMHSPTTPEAPTTPTFAYRHRHVPDKMKYFYTWATAQRFSLFLKTDDDTFINVNTLSTSTNPSAHIAHTGNSTCAHKR